jgi:hypothetical protein
MGPNERLRKWVVGNFSKLFLGLGIQIKEV